MRQPDINRLTRALEHLAAATTLLSNIKWENTTMMEDTLLKKAKENIKWATWYIGDIKNIQNENSNEKK